MAELISGVYSIKNNINGKIYIGSSTNIFRRMSEHKRALRNGSHHNKHLYNAWVKWGEKAFDFSTILFCDRDMIIFYEQRYLNFYNPEYNFSINATAPWLGKTLSENHKLKISKSNMGHIGWNSGIALTKEHRKKISIANMGKQYALGCHWKLSEETRKRISDLQIGNKNAVGYKHTKEAKEKIRVASTGRVLTNETKRKISVSGMGNKNALGHHCFHTQETKAKISASLKKQYAIKNGAML